MTPPSPSAADLRRQKLAVRRLARLVAEVYRDDPRAAAEVFLAGFAELFAKLDDPALATLRRYAKEQIDRRAPAIAGLTTDFLGADGDLVTVTSREAHRLALHLVGRPLTNAEINRTQRELDEAVAGLLAGAIEAAVDYCRGE